MSNLIKKKKEHATVFDVAREARVGTSTVSRVVNGGALVSAKALARVHAAIRKLNYLPNNAAQILKGERTKTIGLIVPSVVDRFFAICVEDAQEVARAHGYLLFVTCSNNDPLIEMENLNTLVQRQVDGILLVPAASYNKELVSALDRITPPVVCFDRPLHKSSVPSVISTHYKGAKRGNATFDFSRLQANPLPWEKRRRYSLRDERAGAWLSGCHERGASYAKNRPFHHQPGIDRAGPESLSARREPAGRDLCN